MKQFIEHENNNLSSLVEFKKKSSVGTVHARLGHGWDVRAFPNMYEGLGSIFSTTGEKNCSNRY